MVATLFDYNVISLKLICVFGMIGFANCKNDVSYEKGTFGYDVAFLSQYQKPILLSNPTSKILLSAEYQGRVLTSTSDGFLGNSYGWINYNLIASQKLNEGGNSFGGEDRFWLGPIGSEYSLFYNQKTIESDNWYIPKAIDTQEYQLIKYSDTTVEFFASLNVKNNIGTPFYIELTRKVSLFSLAEIEAELQIKIPNTIKSVGFQSNNTIKNVGEDWQQENGLIAPWILGMFQGNDESVAIFPFKESEEDTLEVSTYLNPLNQDRLKEVDHTICYKTDGNYRSKVGLKPENTQSIFGHYNAKDSVLTIITYSYNPDGDYLSCNEVEEDVLFGGDVVSSYNNQIPSGTPSFFELESAGEAKTLKQGASTSHIHNTCHFEGDEDELNKLCIKLLGTSIKNVKF
jgi:hypothetical protein